MLKLNLNRRVFVQYLAGSAATLLFPQFLSAGNPEKTLPVKSSRQHKSENTEFVIVNGWVLLKKDLGKL